VREEATVEHSRGPTLKDNRPMPGPALDSH
jgi:hypothetical protein